MPEEKVEIQTEPELKPQDSTLTEQISQVQGGPGVDEGLPLQDPGPGQGPKPGDPAPSADQEKTDEGEKKAEELKTQDQEPQHEFKTWEEAEKAEKEGKRKMHEATQETATVKRELEDLKKKQTEQTDEEFMKSVNADALKKMKAIPEDAPDRYEQEFAVMTETNRQIAAHEARKVSPTVVKEHLDQSKKESDVEGVIATRLNDQDGWSYETHRELFQGVLNGIMAKTPDFQQIALDEQFDMVFDRMRRLLGVSADKLKEAHKVAEKNEEARRSGTVLSRGSTRPAPKDQSPKSETLTEQLQELQSGAHSKFR